MNKLYVENGGMRLDKFLVEHTEYNRSEIKKMQSSIEVNGSNAKLSYQVKTGDLIEINYVEEEFDLLPENITLKVCYEDDYLLIIDKQAGLVIHPGAGNKSGTLVNGLLYHFEKLSSIDDIRPGIVHRIDKDTTGLLIVAKDNQTHEKLSTMFSNKEILREYLALVEGTFDFVNGTIDAPIGRDLQNRQKMAVTNKNSKHAITHFTVIDNSPNYSLIKCKLETGRTHQIRVHMNYINHPVVGDKIYGYKKTLKTSHLLHSYHLQFIHPITGEEIELFAPLPSNFVAVLKEEGIEVYA